MIISHTVKRLCRPCMIISHTVKRPCKPCVIISHTVKRVCKPCIVISYTMKRPCKPCMVISYTVKRLPQAFPKTFWPLQCSCKYISQEKSGPHSNIELTLNKGFDIEKNGFPYKFPRVYETFIPLIMICFTACTQRQEWPHKNWRCPCSLKGHTQTPLIIRKLFPIDYKKGRLPSHNNAPASEL